MKGSTLSRMLLPLSGTAAIIRARAARTRLRVLDSAGRGVKGKYCTVEEVGDAGWDLTPLQALPE